MYVSAINPVAIITNGLVLMVESPNHGYHDHNTVFYFLHDIWINKKIIANIS